MDVHPLVTRVTELALIASCMLPACLPNDDSLDDDASYAFPPPNRDGGGCELIRNKAVQGGCRVDWSCTDAGSLTFVCQPDDAGVVCACLHNEEVQSRPSAGREVCNADGGPAASIALCGWRVAP
jgi:hypothetical protein